MPVATSSIQRPTMPPSLNQNEAVTAVPISEDNEYRGHMHSMESEFAITHGAFSWTLIIQIITDDPGDWNGLSIKPHGPTGDEDLEVMDDETLKDLLPQSEVEYEANTSDSESASDVVVKHFPFGSPGVPVLGRA